MMGKLRQGAIMGSHGRFAYRLLLQAGGEEASCPQHSQTPSLLLKTKKIHSSELTSLD